MTGANRTSSTVSSLDIRIVGLDTNKTRKRDGSDKGYQVFFELSGAPAREWRNIFEHEWKDLNSTKPQLWQEAVIDRGFLAMHCTLQEIAAQLPVLKRAVAETNKAYEQYVQEHDAEEDRRENGRKQERRAVADMAKSLHF